MNQLPAIFPELVKENIDPACEIISTQTIGGGCINHAMLLKTSCGKFFAKYNHNGPPDLFLREAECLEELKKADSGLLVPEVFVKTSIDKDNPGILITEYLPAGSAVNNEEELGRGLAKLHQFTRKQFGFYHHNYCGATLQDNDWNDNWIDFFGRQRIQHLLKLIKNTRSISSEMKTYEILLQKLPEFIPANVQPGLIHGDLWSGNYMETTQGPAVIDPASYYADREMELSIMNMFGGFSSRFWEAYKEAYPLPAGWKERNTLYMLYHYLNHYYLFGGHYGSQAHAIAKKFC